MERFRVGKAERLSNRGYRDRGGQAKEALGQTGSCLNVLKEAGVRVMVECERRRLGLAVVVVVA